MTTMTAEEERLLADLTEAIAASPRRVVAIEVNVPVSIALGKQRPSVSCGGCSTPLEFAGIPASTNLRLSGPFRLLLDPPAVP